MPPPPMTTTKSLWDKVICKESTEEDLVGRIRNLRENSHREHIQSMRTYHKFLERTVRCQVNKLYEMFNSEA